MVNYITTNDDIERHDFTYCVKTNKSFDIQFLYGLNLELIDVITVAVNKVIMR